MTDCIILKRTVDGPLSVFHPLELTCDQIIARGDILPNGVDYEKVLVSSLPSESDFRDAWDWSGPGNPVFEDLEKARTIALDRIKFIALRVAARAEELESLFESPTYSSASIRNAYVSCKQDLNSASTVEELRQCMNTFTTTYEVAN